MSHCSVRHPHRTYRARADRKGYTVGGSLWEGVPDAKGQPLECFASITGSDAGKAVLIVDARIRFRVRDRPLGVSQYEPL